MTIKDGPLTERQERILELLAKGDRHKQIASKLRVTIPVIRMETRVIVTKFGAQTTAQALAKYATGTAYRNAAAQVLSGRIAQPVDETEEHVNHVLEGIAALFRDWSDQRTPR